MLSGCAVRNAVWQFLAAKLAWADTDHPDVRSELALYLALTAELAPHVEEHDEADKH